MSLFREAENEPRTVTRQPDEQRRSSGLIIHTSSPRWVPASRFPARAPTSTNVNHARVKPRLPLRGFQNNSIERGDNCGAGWCQAPGHGPVCRLFLDVNNRCSFCDFQRETIKDVFKDGFHTTGFWLDLQKYLLEMPEKDVVLLFFSLKETKNQQNLKVLHDCFKNHILMS